MPETAPSSSGLLDLYRRHYAFLIRAGLVLAVWFGASARAAHDVWAASVEFAWATALACAFLAGRMADGRPIRLPLLAPAAAFLAAVALSFRGAYDRNTTLLETWIWIFSFLLTLLFVNVVEDETQLDRVLSACAVSLVPLAVRFGSWLAPGSELHKAQVMSNLRLQLAVVGLLLAAFYSALYFIVRVVEKKDSRWTRAAFLAALACHIGILLFTQRTIMVETEAPLINDNVLVGFALCWFFVLWEKVFERPAWLAVFAPCCFILMAERSWLAYVAILAGFLVYQRDFFWEAARRHRKLFAAAAAAAAALFSVIVGVKASQHVPTVLGVSRVLWWRAAARAFWSSPWTGVGAGGFATAYPFFKAGRVDGTLHAHSFYFQLLVETGAAGFLTAAFLAWRYVRSLAAGGRSGAQRRAVAATLAAILLFASIHINLEYFLNKLVLLLLLAALLTGREAPARRIKPLFLGAAAAGLLLAIPYWLALYSSSALFVSGREALASGDRAKAEALFRDALSVDPTNADSDFALASIASEKFRESGSPEALAEARSRLQDGLRQRRDYAVITRLAAPGRP
ncbi:MAG TPA: O-antigen ligase family protein [Elusimicrobiota bacterium]|nr:O-antigen ligase family protein [Elusimicrobiota bacterium]